MHALTRGTDESDTRPVQGVVFTGWKLLLPVLEKGRKHVEVL